MIFSQLSKKITDQLNNLRNAEVVDEELVNVIVKNIAIALLESDIDIKSVLQYKQNVIDAFKQHNNDTSQLKKTIRHSILFEFTSLFQSTNNAFMPIRNKSNVILFIGLQGSGKTSSAHKYAKYWKRKGWRVAQVCADTFKRGFDALRSNRQQIPYYGSYTETDPLVIAEEGVKLFKQENFEIIIIDTSGRHKQESVLFDEMKQIEEVVIPDESILVIDSSLGQACLEQAIAFRKQVKVGSVFLTKVDGHLKAAGALNAISLSQNPICFLGTGEHIEDLESFKAESFVQRILGFGFGDKFPYISLDQIKDIQEMDRFSFKLLKNQFKNILKLESIENAIFMVPGFEQSNFKGINKVQEAKEKMQRQLIIMESMSAGELEDINNINKSQLQRIAKGSGSSIEDVEQFINQYQAIAKSISTPIKQSPSMLNIPSLNNNMIKAMGGMDNIKAMLQSMSKMGGVELLMKDLQNKNKK